MAAGASDIAASDAVQLFIARATERLPDFRAADVAPHAIAELCRRLDGLPLAIELIAGWVGTLSIREILQQRAVLLDSEPAQVGQHSGRRLADVLQVSYDLLTPEQQRRLAMLSVLGRLVPDRRRAGGTRPGRADRGCHHPAAGRLVLAGGDPRQRAEPVQHAGDDQDVRRPCSSSRPATARRPGGGTRCTSPRIAAGSEQGLAGPDAADWTRRLEAAVADLHAALHWADEHADVDLGLDISAALWRWWLVSGRLAVGRNWLARFLTQAGPREDELAGRALCSAAVLAAENGDYAGAITSAERALAIFGTLGLKLRMTLAATVLGSAHRYLGNHEPARHGFQLAMDLRAELGDRRGMSVAINNMALLELDDGNIDRARELFEQALAIKREFGEQRSIAIRPGQPGRRADQDQPVGRRRATLLREGAAMAAAIRSSSARSAATRARSRRTGRTGPRPPEHFRAAIAASQAGGHPHDGSRP